MDVLTIEQRRLNMSRIRGRDTKPELMLRRALHAKGFRFRLQDSRLPGRPDIVFPKYQSVILVHGCFWHGHGCALFKWPSTRKEFWEKKIIQNRQRDERAIAALLEKGWRVLVVWECSLRGPAKRPVWDIAATCAQFLESPAASYAELPSG